MLTGIKFKNYKAFQEGKLEIKPITILLGANSVGKSSLIQLFLMLQETALAQNYKSALKLHGGFFSLGEGINLFRKKDNNNTLHFQIEFREPSITDIIKKEFLGQFIHEIINYSSLILTQYREKEKDIKIDDIFRRILKNRQHREIGFFTREAADISNINSENILSLIDAAHKATSQRTKGRELLKELNNSLFYFANNVMVHSLVSNKEELIMTYEFLKKLDAVEEKEKITLDYDFTYSESILKIKTFRLTIGNVNVAQIDFEKSIDSKLFFTSSLIDLTKINAKHITDFRKLFKNNKTVFSFIEKNESDETNPSIICHYLSNIISQVIDKLEESFNSQRINYVSPLRAHPKRYYFLDKAKVNAFLDTLDGEAIAEILKENSALKSSVNNWFKKFNLHIDVGPIKDIIHQIVVKQNSLDLDITDVGFGVSQVLPVIIQGFLSKDKSITLIEQPEIHLHPKMQADLADLFIDIAIKKNKKGSFIPNKFLIIETHSEYLLKRLRRRISENKFISADQVAIYYIEPQEETKSATIKKIDINSKGSFEWPKDFYTGDLADDITEFLKNQF